MSVQIDDVKGEVETLGEDSWEILCIRAPEKTETKRDVTEWSAKEAKVEN